MIKLIKEKKCDRKAIRVISVIIILIMIFFLIPEIPYKIPRNNKNKDLIKLKIEYQWTAEFWVREGNEEVADFIVENDIKDVTDKEIGITGNTPFKELINYGIGEYKYNELTVYGYLTDKKDIEGNLIFDVKQWYPSKRWVAIKDTKILNDFLINIGIFSSYSESSAKIMLMQMFLILLFIICAIVLVILVVKKKRMKYLEED